MYKAVVFDMDGVILDSEKIYRIYETKAAEHFGLPTDRIDEFCKRIAGGTKETNSLVFDSFFDTDLHYYDYREVVNEGVERHAEENGYEVKPGVKELFDFLKENGIKMALATSTSEERAKRFLTPHGLLDYFDAMIFGDAIEPGRGKPHPDIYLTACKALGVEPSDTIGVEDSINGIKSSSAAGLYTVMVIDLIQPDEEEKKIPDVIYDRIIKIKELF